MFLKNQAAFFSANLHQYLPDIPWSEHPHLFKRYQAFHHARPIGHGKPVEAFTRLQLGSSSPPGLLAAFHLGTHSELPVSLARSGVAFDVLIDRQVHERYQNAISITDKELVRMGHSPTCFYYSDDPRLFFQIRRSLKSGRHVLIFVDGNGGREVKEEAKETASTWLEIPFFKGSLWLRQGVAVLARVLQAPIYPILNSIDPGPAHFQLRPPIWPDSGLSRAEDAKRILRLLYGELALYLRQDHLMRWECWTYLHLHDLLRMHRGTTEDTFAFPDPIPEYVVPLGENSRSLWLDKKHYLIYTGMT